MARTGPGDVNFRFIDHTVGKQAVELDKQGHLRVAGFVKSFFQKRDPQLDKIAIEYARAKFASREFVHENGPQNYEKLMGHLAELGLISDANKNQITKEWYETRTKDLIDSGWQKEFAEAIVAFEKVEDPNISLAEKAAIGLRPTGVGTTGSYFLDKIGVYKPQDEEWGMPNNKSDPYQYNPQYAADMQMRKNAPRRGYIQGTGYLRERSAHTIGGRFGAPPTAIIEVPFKGAAKNATLKKGSFQLFVKGGPIALMTDEQKKAIPVKEMQRIALLDLLIGNSDRNQGNLFYDPQTGKLGPIDHALAFLDSLDPYGEIGYSEIACEWLVFPQTDQPLDPDLLKEMLGLDLDIESQKLRDDGHGEGAIREFRLRNQFVKIALQHGLTLYQIALLQVNPTFLDNMVNETKQERLPNFADFEKSFVDKVEKNIDAAAASLPKREDIK